MRPVVMLSGLGRRAACEALVVAKIEIGFRAIVGDEDLAVLVGAHRARIDVEIRDRACAAAPGNHGLQQRSESRGRNSFSERGNHAASDEYISRHGSYRLPFQKRFHQP
jgi:hypothetical protein